MHITVHCIEVERVDRTVGRFDIELTVPTIQMQACISAFPLHQTVCSNVCMAGNHSIVTFASNLSSLLNMHAASDWVALSCTTIG